MDAFCEYCGAKLDVENDNCCAQCGAPFDENESVKKYREEKSRREERQKNIEELRLRQQQAQYNNAQQSQNTQPNPVSQQNANANRVNKIVVTVIIAICFGPMLLGILGSIIGVVFDVVDELGNDTEYTTRKPFTTFASASDIVQESSVEVGFNETAVLEGYSFICDEAYRTDIKYGGAGKGYMYVVFHFIVKNTTDEKLWLSNDLNCIYDGDMICDKAYGIDEKSFNAYASLSAGLGTDGYICYKVPENADSVVIAYGDNLKVNIDLSDIEDRREETDSESNT